MRLLRPSPPSDGGCLSPQVYTVELLFLGTWFSALLRFRSSAAVAVVAYAAFVGAMQQVQRVILRPRARCAGAAAACWCR